MLNSTLSLQSGEMIKEMALPCVAIYPEMDITKGKFLGFKVAAPDGPLRHYFQQDDTKKIFYDLMKDASVDALAKKEEKRAGNVVESSASVVKVLAVMKPPRPIWDLTLKEIETYFSSFKSVLAAQDGVKLKRKWPKRVDGETTELPTKLPSMDDVTEKILPSSAYIPFKKFSLGNLHWRLKLLNAYLLLKNNLDPNTYARTIPEGYRAKKNSLDDVKNFSDNVEKFAKEHDDLKQKKKSNKRPEMGGFEVPFYLEDDGADYDDWSDDDNIPATQDSRRTMDKISATPKSSNSPQQSSSGEIMEIPPPTQLMQTSDRTPVIYLQDTEAVPPQEGRTPCPTPRSPRKPTTGPSGTRDPRSRRKQSLDIESSSRTLPLHSQHSRNMATCKSFERRIETTLPNGFIQVSVDEPNDCLHDLNENDDILNSSHQTGTPQNSLDEENSEDELMAALEAETNDDHKYLEMMKDTDIRKVLIGGQTLEPILQVFNFQNLSQGKCYRAHAHDGKATTTKFAFTADINDRVGKLIGHQPILRITNFKLYNGSFIVVTDFDIVKVLESSVATPDYLTDKDYEYLREVNKKSHGNLPQTPTLISKKLTKKHIKQIEEVSGRSTSQRLKNRSQGSNL